MATPDSDDNASVSSWGSSSSSESQSPRSTVGNRSAAVISSRSSVSTAPPPGKYKKRRRVYERIKANARYQPLATVPEGEELRDANTWFGPKIAGILVVVLICIAGIKELSSFLSAFSDVDGRRDGKTDSSLRGGAKRIISSLSGQSEIEQQDAAEAHALMLKAQIPPELKFLAGVNDPVLPSDRVFLWHVPRSASATVKAIAAQCFGLLLATEVGGASASDRLAITSDLEGGNYVNVDTSTPAGIEHAKKMNLPNLPGLNLVASSFFYEAAENLFSDQHKGRCIAMIRHPVDRAVSLYALHLNTPNSPLVLPGMSLMDYANSDRVERNWMTRFLSNAKDADLTSDHLGIAMKVMETKCLVGLLKYKGASLSRIETFFGWTMDGTKASGCHSKLLDWNWPNKNKHAPIREGSEVWRKLADVNDLDMKLYKHAERVYKMQGEVFSRSAR
ncbi:hypothetical protein MHU86_21776 [Fragilaria crotonensis]|nr:hypothetical protein MHU86_21776 [Fragilaria crotonensis]